MMTYGNIPKALVQQKWDCQIKQNQAPSKAKREENVVLGYPAKDIRDGFKTQHPNDMPAVKMTANLESGLFLTSRIW